jgi:hypothetical protein
VLRITGNEKALIAVQSSIFRQVCDAMLGGYSGILFIVDRGYAGFRRVVVGIQLVLASALLDSDSWMMGVVVHDTGL